MSTEDNKALARRWLDEVWNRNGDVLDLHPIFARFSDFFA